MSETRPSSEHGHDAPVDAHICGLPRDEADGSLGKPFEVGHAQGMARETIGRLTKAKDICEHPHTRQRDGGDIGCSMRAQAYISTASEVVMGCGRLLLWRQRSDHIPLCL